MALNGLPGPSERECDLELAGYANWQREQAAKGDPWVAILGDPPTAPTWHLEWQAQRDQMGAGLSWVIETVAAGGHAIVKVSADRVTIELPTAGAG